MGGDEKDDEGDEAPTEANQPCPPSSPFIVQHAEYTRTAKASRLEPQVLCIDKEYARANQGFCRESRLHKDQTVGCISNYDQGKAGSDLNAEGFGFNLTTAGDQASVCKTGIVFGKPACARPASCSASSSRLSRTLHGPYSSPAWREGARRPSPQRCGCWG